ncbi:MAG: DedA family protein, partial [Actinomycetota bacterium]
MSTNGRDVPGERRSEVGDLLGDISRWIVETVYSFGYAGVFVLVALAGLHLPVPMEITLPLSGYLVEQGRFSFVPT